jgi:hypothetical protein
MQYDLENARQLPDLQCLPEHEREMFFAMDYGPQGLLYVARGNRIDLVKETGRTVVSYPLEGNGWATLRAAADGRHLYIGNFFSGKIVKLELESGDHVAVADTGVARSLAGIAEYTVAPDVARSSSRRGRVAPGRAVRKKRRMPLKKKSSARKKRPVRRKK